MNIDRSIIGLEFKRDNIFIFLSVLLATFPVQSFGIRSGVMIVWAIVGLSSWRRGLKNFSTIGKIELSIITFLLITFLLLILSLLNSDDKSEGLKKITQMLAFVIIPVVFYLNKSILNKEVLETVIKFFCFSTLLIVLYQLIFLMFNFHIFTDDLSITEIKRNNLHHLSEITSEQINQIKIRRLRNFILGLVDSHPTYQGIWSGVTIFYFLSSFRIREHNSINNILCVFFSSILFFWMFLIAARMPIIAILLAGLITILKFKKNFYYVLIILVLFVFVAILSYKFVDPIRTKIDELVNSIFVLPTKGNDIYNFNSTNVRTGIYRCAIMVAQDNWLFGTGIGDIQEALNNCYSNEIGAKIFTWHKYNSHNQYLFFLISTGIFGLISFVLLLYTLILKSFFTKNMVLFFFILLVSLVLLTENIISRSDGVLFFSLFSGIILSTEIKTIIG